MVQKIKKRFQITQLICVFDLGINLKMGGNRETYFAQRTFDIKNILWVNSWLVVVGEKIKIDIRIVPCGLHPKVKVVWERAKVTINNAQKIFFFVFFGIAGR